MLTNLCFQGSHNFARFLKNTVIFIGADHLTLEGGGGVGKGDFRQKYPAD